MRQIVVGQMTTNAGIQQINVWFRFPVVASRQTYYSTVVKPPGVPQAPGDYAGGDSAEATALQAGQWVERPGFIDIIDPTSSLATIQTRLQNIWTAASTAFKNSDDAVLANWDSSWNGTTWTMKSA